MKEFYGKVSVVARIYFRIEAEDVQDAKDKLFDANLPLNLIDDSENRICEIDAVDWHMVDEAAQGNVQESDLSDFEIYEEKDD
jgi:hypothetical protein